VPLSGLLAFRHCATSLKVAGSVPDGIMDIFINLILPAAYVPGVDSTSTSKEYQEFPGGRDKDGQCVGLTTLPSSCADSKPQPRGALGTCTGIPEAEREAEAISLCAVRQR
jgi:hypothetical protein